VSAVPPSPAGAGRYTIDLAAALVRCDDLKLSFVARRHDAERWTALSPESDVHAVAPASRPARLAWEQVALPRLLRTLDMDVHHSPHYTMPESATVPRVVTIHDLTFFDHPEWHERTKAPLFRRATRVAARHAQALVCVSQTTADRLVALCQPDSPVHVIPHGVALDRFTPEPADDAAVLSHLRIRPPYVAFVGTLEPRKDLPTLVQAFDRVAFAHPDLSLVLAGYDGWGARDLDRAISTATHSSRILRTGYLPDGVVPALLRQAAAVAYPSFEEGFGLPALEALACGAPLVTTTGSAMEELVAGAALLVEPADVGALAGVLDMLVRGDALLEARRRRGLAIAARHTWEASADAHLGVYRSVASPGQR